MVRIAHLCLCHSAHGPLLLQEQQDWLNSFHAIHADSAKVPLLVHGLVELFVRQANGSSQPQATWRSHLLSKTLCAHQDASYQLMEGIHGLLLEIDRSFCTMRGCDLWMHLRPFLSYSLLDHGPQGSSALHLCATIVLQGCWHPSLFSMISHAYCHFSGRGRHAIGPPPCHWAAEVRQFNIFAFPERRVTACSACRRTAALRFRCTQQAV